MTKIVIGCDNAALELKQEIEKFLNTKGIVVEDVGCENEDDAVFYPFVAKKVCEIIMESNYEKEGILLCGTGLGMCITANKFKGIRATVCHDNYSAERSKLSNNANVLCMGARVIGKELAKKIINEWISTDFKGGNSESKVQVILDIEGENLK